MNKANIKGKPMQDEMRLIGGKVMVWDGKKWLTESEWNKWVASLSKVNS